MPASEKQQVLKSSSHQSHRRTSGPAGNSGKMAGTRVGGMVDWREGSAKGTGEKSRLNKRSISHLAKTTNRVLAHREGCPTAGSPLFLPEGGEHSSLIAEQSTN
jgi:hypothetical protein